MLTDIKEEINILFALYAKCSECIVIQCNLVGSSFKLKHNTHLNRFIKVLGFTYVCIYVYM